MNLPELTTETRDNNIKIGTQLEEMLRDPTIMNGPENGLGSSPAQRIARNICRKTVEMPDAEHPTAEVLRARNGVARWFKLRWAEGSHDTHDIVTHLAEDGASYRDMQTTAHSKLAAGEQLSPREIALTKVYINEGSGSFPSAITGQRHTVDQAVNMPNDYDGYPITRMGDIELAKNDPDRNPEQGILYTSDIPPVDARTLPVDPSNYGLLDRCHFYTTT